MTPIRFIDIGPECFTDTTELVISYKGQNYYLACDELVYEHDGTKSHCVKRRNHPGNVHEAYNGQTREYLEEGISYGNGGNSSTNDKQSRSEADRSR